MNITLKALLTTAAIFSMPSVFASGAELLGGGAQPEHGSRGDIIVEKLTTAKEFERSGRTDEALIICRAVAGDPASTVNQKFEATAVLNTLGHSEAASAICKAVAANPTTPIAQQLEAAWKLNALGLRDEAADIYRAVAGNPATAIAQQLEAAWTLNYYGHTAEAVVIYRTVAENPASTEVQKSRAEAILQGLASKAMVEDPQRTSDEKLKAPAQPSN